MNEYMREAIAEAERGIHAGDGGPFGCVVVKDGKVIGKGHNEVIKRKDPTCHGEIMAIHEACRNLDSFDLAGCELYTTGEPCPMCMGAILWSNIAQVYYGCNIADTEEIGFRDKAFYEFTAEKRAQMVRELDRAECKKLYRDYRNLSEKTSY